MITFCSYKSLNQQDGAQKVKSKVHRRRSKPHRVESLVVLSLSPNQPITVGCNQVFLGAGICQLSPDSVQAVSASRSP